MFIGKSVCVLGAVVIVGTCIAASLDKDVTPINKAKLITLSLSIAGIVASL